MAKKQHQDGFTLQELMISIAIFFIITAIGIPGYISFVRNGTRDNTVTDLNSNMYYARSEALKLNTDVTLCRTANTTATNPTCGGSANNWSTGWLVFVDNNGNHIYDAGDNLLKIGLPAKSGIQVLANANADAYITYGGDGSLVSTPPARFTVCDDRNGDGTYDPQYGRLITVSPMGRPEITSTSTINTCTPP